VLGAGLDTFAYRNPHEALRVFEVDHPATQAWKRQRLAEANIAAPDTLTFTPVDFERVSLAEGLAAAGFDAAAPPSSPGWASCPI
jgi:methyltransferase (TIGR00027 family)